MRKYLIILTLVSLSCSKEYSVERTIVPTHYNITFYGNGNNEFDLILPDTLRGHEADVTVQVTLYSSGVDSIGRNDYIAPLFYTTGLMKYKDNPVLKNVPTISARMKLPDTLRYYSTTYFVPSGFWSAYDSTTWPKFTDTVRLSISL